MTSYSSIIHKIEDKTARIGIVGLGYVGLPLAIRFAEVGYKTVGFDIDPIKTECLASCQTYIEHIPDDTIQELIATGFEATTDFSQACEIDALILCVPTPLNQYREPYLSYVINSLESLLPHIRAGQLISLESTTYPGTTEEELKPRIESKGFEIGKDIFLIYSPEREDPGNADFTSRSIPKVCGGTTKKCAEVGKSLYGNIIDTVVPVSSTKVAEMTKLLENIHRAVNIGLVNEMKIVADAMDIDIYEVIRAAATKPFGFVPYYPGPGLGGHCIPIDPFYFTWKAKEYGLNTRFIELAGEINSQMPQWVVNKTTMGLNDQKKSVNGSNILILGIAYKKNVGDTRESPSLEIIDTLQALGACIRYSDPHVPICPQTRKYNFELSSVSLSEKTISFYDAIILVTDHDCFDYPLIKDHAKLIVDTRGVFDRSANIINA